MLYCSGHFELKPDARALLKGYMKSLGCTYSVTQKNDLLDRQRKLEARITTYAHRISLIMKLDDNALWSIQGRKEPDGDSDLGDTLYDPLELYPDGWFAFEMDQVTLPSALAPGEIEHLFLKQIAMIEFEL